MGVRVKDMHPIRNTILILSMLFVSLAHGQSNFQQISVENGRLVFANGEEVNLWGFNFQSSLSWEHGARMHNQGVLMPLKAADLKDATNTSLNEVQRLGAELIRLHLMPADFTDREGNLVETIWLDALDHTMAEAEHRGLYVYMTFLNHLNHDGTQFPYDQESFAARFPREDWMFKKEAIDSTRNCIRQLLNRRNPYTGRLYKEHESIAVVEPINEPAYVWYEKWKDHNADGTLEAFEQWSYDNTLRYLNNMVSLIREEGLSVPVVWNCGWESLIKKHRSAYRAIADSEVDAVSFCFYPGQSDLKVPFWENPEDLSDRNYLPYIEDCSANEDRLGWLRSERFKDKAKIVYEFETFCNQSAYMYPAMAEFYESVGAQIAAQWTYGLSAYAGYLGGSHVFNLKPLLVRQLPTWLPNDSLRALIQPIHTNPAQVPFTMTAP